MLLLDRICIQEIVCLKKTIHSNTQGNSGRHTLIKNHGEDNQRYRSILWAGNGAISRTFQQYKHEPSNKDRFFPQKSGHYLLILFRLNRPELSYLYIIAESLRTESLSILLLVRPNCVSLMIKYLVTLLHYRVTNYFIISETQLGKVGHVYCIRSNEIRKFKISI